jgi:hypothetical protein
VGVFGPGPEALAVPDSAARGTTVAATASTIPADNRALLEWIMYTVL